MTFQSKVDRLNGTSAPKWANIILRTVGILNAILALLGTAFLLGNVHDALSRHQSDPAAPHFWIAFWGMTVVNVAFLLVLLITAIRFIQIRVSAITFYSLAVLMLFVYDFGVGMVWRAAASGRARMSIALSVAAATGIGNGGVAAFVFLFVVPFLYPLVTVILVQVIRNQVLSRNASTLRTAPGE